MMAVSGLGALALEVRTPSGSFSLKDRTWDGTTWFCAEDLASALHGTYGKDPVSTYPSLNLSGKRILISTASVVVSVEGKIIKIQHVPVQKDGCLWLPVEFLTMALPVVVGGPVSTGPGLPGPGTAKPVPPAGPGPTTPPARPEEPKLPLPLPGEPEGPVTYDIVVSADSVRLTLTGTMAPLADIKQLDREVVITLPKGSFSGGSREVGEGIVEKVLVEKGSPRLSVRVGTTFKRAESLKLRNPDRLVVIFKGDKQTVSAVPPPPPPPATPETTPKQEEPPPPSTSAPPRRTSSFDVVVLDPGHGGSDTGAIGPTGVQEKDITLALAQKLASDLEKQGIKVILTRTTDTSVPLMERTALANYNQADLFLSIHLNSSPSPSAKGAETYYLSKQATDIWSSELAARENTDAGESVPVRGQLDLVLWDLAQTSFIVESAALAERIQFEFNTLLDTKDRGVRQAPFVVLEGAQMPAVLVEVAFLSNPREGKRLSDTVFQDQVAFALGKAIQDFKARNEKPAQTPAP